MAVHGDDQSVALLDEAASAFEPEVEELLERDNDGSERAATLLGGDPSTIDGVGR